MKPVWTYSHDLLFNELEERYFQLNTRRQKISQRVIVESRDFFRIIRYILDLEEL
jgi:hypothetical protein